MNWPDYGDERLPERFWERVYPEPNTGCWLWGGSCCSKGYGQYKAHRKSYAVHLVIFEALVGELVYGRLIRTCPARLCLNPAHRRLTHGAKLRRPTVRFGEVQGSIVWSQRIPVAVPTMVERLRRAERMNHALLVGAILAESQARAAGVAQVRAEAERDQVRAELRQLKTRSLVAA